jgi:uncharacterized lipoprotein
MPAAFPAPRVWIAGALTLAMAAVLGGCAVKKDMRYLESQEIPPLSVPADLDTPVYTGAMAIPRPAADNTSQVPSDEGALRALERPPARVPVSD